MQAFELRDCLRFYQLLQSSEQEAVMASLVVLDGSSYRQAGVRMLIAQDGAMCGAISGGCVESEIVISAQSVFKSGVSKVISYDGRYRLGCEGLLHILIEPFKLSKSHTDVLLDAIYKRQQLQITSYYRKGTTLVGNFYSTITIQGFREPIAVNTLPQNTAELIVFKQTVYPNHQLIIIGSEHDAVKLSANAVLVGWDVLVICSLKNPKKATDFPGVKKVIRVQPETFDDAMIDAHTSVVLMTHNYATDLKYLLKLKNCDLTYIGILGSKKRKAALENELIEQDAHLEVRFLEQIYSPAGLNIGAITPQEIAISIIAEILQIIKKRPAPRTTLETMKRTLS